ncbi:hypothetical protein KA013_00475 [Patescibacteria group bacterium]|nr:hypothetical protein [Patescibacteria group bacterium]
MHEAQPFKSDVLGDKVTIGGKPISIQATNEKEEFNADRIDINLAGNGPGVTTDVIALDRDYLK